MKITSGDVEAVNDVVAAEVPDSGVSVLLPGGATGRWGRSVRLCRDEVDVTARVRDKRLD